MALEEQVLTIARGTAVWNAWRDENRDVPVDLSGANLSKLDLAGANLAHADLSGALLGRARLAGASLAFADCEGATLAYADLAGADLRGASLNGAWLEDANLAGADLSHANLSRATLAYSDLRGAKLLDAELAGADLTAANLDGANVSGVCFDHRLFWPILRDCRANPLALWRRRRDLLLDTTLRCRGVNLGSAYGSQMFRLFLQDVDYMEEYLASTGHRLSSFAWWLFADCGRSLARWVFWSFLMALAYAMAYTALGPGHIHTERLPFNPATMVYYSLVTFTTLGFGDITPLTDIAAIMVTTEVILGYVMLGGLITIFATKLARRGG